MKAPYYIEILARNGDVRRRERFAQLPLSIGRGRKFPGLYDFGLLTASVDAPRTSLQTRVDIDGVSYESGLRMAQLLLASISREGTR